MKLELQIDSDIKKSMLEKSELKLQALRQIKSSIQVEKAKDGKELSDEQVIKIIQKLVSQGTESARQYEEGGRMDLVNQELSLIVVYKTFLPEQMSEEEITEKVKQIITETGSTTVRDMGKVMTSATKVFAGRADNKLIGSIVKKLLS
jgi:uncharacterized protein YqeY